MIKRNTIVSIGWNKLRKTHPIAKQFGYRFNNIHSELDVILNCKYKYLNRLTLVNIRLNEDGIMLAKPCKICQELLIYYGITSVIYSQDANERELWKRLRLIKKQQKNE